MSNVKNSPWKEYNFFDNLDDDIKKKSNLTML